MNIPEGSDSKHSPWADCEKPHVTPERPTICPCCGSSLDNNYYFVECNDDNNVYCEWTIIKMIKDGDWCVNYHLVDGKWKRITK